jgi:hypothetical protein
MPAVDAQVLDVGAGGFGDDDAGGVSFNGRPGRVTTALAWFTAFGGLATAIGAGTVRAEVPSPIKTAGAA